MLDEEKRRTFQGMLHRNGPEKVRGRDRRESTDNKPMVIKNIIINATESMPT